MSRRIYNVDTIIVPTNRGVLSKNRYPTLSLLVVRVHDPFSALTLPIKRPRLLKQAINEGCLAVVYVRDNRDISKILNHWAFSFVGLFSWGSVFGALGVRAGATVPQATPVKTVKKPLSD